MARRMARRVSFVEVRKASGWEQRVASKAEEEKKNEEAKFKELLKAAGQRRTTGDLELRCLAFTRMELRALSGTKEYDWLRRMASDIDVVLKEADPRRRTLLRRAARCFRRRDYSILLPLQTIEIYRFVEYEWKYRHRSLLPAGSDLGLPPQVQAAEAGGLPPVGIHRPTKKLLWWLTPQEETDRSLRVMAIVGPAGIGKTTLAMELHRRVQCQTSGGHHYFQCIVMAQACRRAHRNEILLEDILSQIPKLAAPAFSSDDSDQSQVRPIMELLVQHVSERLQDKRYFIIIDGIWEASDWGKIKGAFPNNNLHSRILVTTRYRSIAWTCCSDSDGEFVHEMKPLNQMDSERLLLTRALGSVDGCLPDNLKVFCDEILRRCQGVPLFITSMADSLKEQFHQQQQQQRREEEEHQRFVIYSEERAPQLPKRLEEALSSAFSDLPYELRFPLLCMSMFPCGYKFDKDRLIMKVFHEGLVDTSDYKEAKKYFSQLLDWNVITCVAANCKHNPDEAEGCQWHVNPCMLQYLNSKSADMGFAFTSATLNLVGASATGHGNETSSRIPRRLALHHPDPNIQRLLRRMDLSQIRSLAGSGAVRRIPLEKFLNLVVLDLEGWENLEDVDLLRICRSKMLFLTYLSVRNTRVSKIPTEIKELWILQVLDASYTQVSELPLQVFQLRCLERLDLRGTRIRQLPKHIVGLRHDLCALLVGGEGRINSTETAATRMPEGISRLVRLETLSTVDLSEQPASFVEELGHLHKLRVLAITWSFHQSTDGAYCKALLSSIKGWQDLQSLTINCGLGCSMEFLGSLSDPPRELQKFKVTTGRFASVPQWINGLGCLSFVQITICRPEKDDLKILGDLPKLQCLILGLDFIPVEAIVIESARFIEPVSGKDKKEEVFFTELQRFSVDCPMPWLTFQTGAMRKLAYLELKFCATPASQTSVPSGISNLHRLKEVDLCYNAQYINSPSVKMTVEAVRKEVAKHRNPIDLFINGIEDDDVHTVNEEIENATGTPSGTDAGARDDAQAVDEQTTAAVQSEITEAES